jgi:hypothetical protein
MRRRRIRLSGQYADSPGDAWRGATDSLRDRCEVTHRMPRGLIFGAAVRTMERLRRPLPQGFGRQDPASDRSRDAALQHKSNGILEPFESQTAWDNTIYISYG